MAVPVNDVAEFIIFKSTSISNLKLQKLLYYVQGWHLGLKGTPLFNESIQAWVHGPVVPMMFQRYKICGWNSIPRASAPPALPLAESRHIDEVLGKYGKYAADQLERLSHSESPWIDARKGLGPYDPSNAVITHASMRDYFGARAKT
jgi:uncharacterized phage-associated protein